MKRGENDGYIPALSFDFLTPLYDPVVALTTRERAFKSALAGQARWQPLQTILDLGCGTATLTLVLKQSCPQAEIFGLDGDEKILALARRKAEKAGVEINLDKGLSFEMPYASGYFDSVVSSLFFHHLTPENKQKTLAEVFRVLKPNGFLHVADWGKPANFLMKIASMPVEWLDGATTKDSFQGRLPELIKEAGLTGITETANFDTMFGTIRIHKAEKRIL
jgi:ubiquinone/menaquinone biosynthesis C-methylase UbiE